MVGYELCEEFVLRRLRNHYIFINNCCDQPNSIDLSEIRPPFVYLEELGFEVFLIYFRIRWIVRSHSVLVDVLMHSEFVLSSYRFF